MGKLTKELRSKNMKAVKNKGSKIETLLMKALWQRGYRYRKNDKSIFGKPDIAFKKYKIVIFCDSEFWHGKDWEIKIYEIKSNKEFWYNKIESNIERDKLVNKTLQEQGWIVMRFWGKEIQKYLNVCLEKIITQIERVKSNEFYKRTTIR
ncbi:MAG: very short patch repair endonuclease [Mariniphaga sp.]|nr:very short patch repair endonuclease [Mariniphaga sp.]